MNYSKRGLFDQSTGYLESFVGGGWYRGSGVVARDPRLIYSCGHLFYDNGVWATDYLFYRAYHDTNIPDPAFGASPRGFRYFTNYGDHATAYGSDSGRAFSYDFTVLYGAASFGPAVGYWPDGGAVIRSTQQKQIVGYPASIEYTGDSGDSYQYGTDPFTDRGYQLRDAYYGFDDISTGEGNSGGPILVKDAAGEESFLAGILVSGSYATAGVYALNDNSNSMASAALGLETVTRTFANTSPLNLPDGGSTYSTRKATSSGFSDTITGLKFSMTLTTPRRGDMDVYLRSPSGRIRWINKASSDSSRDIVISGANFTKTFRGYAPNGGWHLKMRDTARSNRATFNRFSIAVTGYGE